jgi:putative FmdB family regulatory protein
MPIYELRCESCGHEFEELVFRRADVEEVACPQCGTKRVGLLMSAFSSGGGGKSSSGSSAGGSCGSGGFT